MSINNKFTPLIICTIRLLRRLAPRNDPVGMFLTVLSLRALRCVLLSPSLCHSERSEESSFIAQDKLRAAISFLNKTFILIQAHPHL